MTFELGRIWVYLSAKPLLWLTVTVLVFILSSRINRWAKGSPVVHPVILSMAILIGLLLITGTSYDQYFQGAQFVHFLLGPATVALAVPLYDNLEHVRKVLVPLGVACLTGAATASASAVGIAWLMGGSLQTILSMAPKSVTSPIAMGISDQIGGLPSLTAGMVLLTGTIGCIAAPPVFRLLRIRDDRTRGFALGLSAHGFGTAQALTISATAGAFAGLGLGLAGLVTAFLLPLAVRLAGG